MKKIHYISNSSDRLSDLTEYEVTGAPLSTKLSPSMEAKGFDLVLVDKSDLGKANQKMFDGLMAVLKKGNRPILLLSQTSLITELGQLEHVRSGLNGVITRETLKVCVETLMNLEPVDPDYDWDIVLSLVQPFAHAACEVLETTAKAKTRVLGFVTGRVVPPNGEMAGCMALEGDIDGLAVAVLTQKQASKLGADIALCTEADLDDADIMDGVKEIINQVSGRVRTLEWAEGRKFTIDLPHIFHLAHKDDTFHSAPGWITILIECCGQICSMSLKASKAKKLAVVS